MTSFQDQWAPTWEVKKTIPGARTYVEENTDRTYRSGRPVVDVVYFDQNRREVCRRSGMRLTSKKGNEYVVCRREPEREPERGTGVDATDTSPATTVGELFDDL